MQTYSDAPGGRVSFACYKPKPGKDDALRAVVATHVPILRGQGLATERESIIVRSKDGTIVEVFEWVSDHSIEQAHTNPAVLEMWKEFEEVCEYVKLADLPEMENLFVTFDAA